MNQLNDGISEENQEAHFSEMSHFQNPESKVKAHNTKVLLKCSLCPYTTNSKQIMDKHTAGHERAADGKMYECKICHIHIAEKSNLFRHMSKHSEPKYFCDFCQKVYNRSDQMKDHMMTHIKKGFNFECPVSLCGKKCFLFTELEAHMDKIHKISTENEAECKICKKKFAKSKQLRLHFFTIHREDSENPSEPSAKKMKLDEGQMTGESSKEEIFPQFVTMIQNPVSKIQKLEIQIPSPSDDLTSSEVSNCQTLESGGSPAPEEEDQKLENYSNLPSTSTSTALLAEMPIVQFLPCDPCGIIFMDPFLYTLHKSLHSIDDPFKCALCGEQCDNKYMFMVHTSTGNHSKN